MNIRDLVQVVRLSKVLSDNQKLVSDLQSTESNATLRGVLTARNDALIKELEALGVQFDHIIPITPSVKIKLDDDCGNCRTCLQDVTEDGWPVVMTRMIVCITCGNKRCPHATDHKLVCTNSNEPQQPKGQSTD